MTRSKAYFFVSEALSEDDVCPLVFTNEVGKVAEEPTNCPLAQLHESVGDCPLIIIVPDRLVSIHKVSLPLLSDKKARSAIPYALEDFSAQEVTELHFAFDRKFYKDGYYLVLSCDKIWLQSLMTLLKKYQLDPKYITIAWFALSDNQCILHNQALTCRSQAFNGIIPLIMWDMIAKQFPSTDDLTTLRFNEITDTPSELENHITLCKQNWETWVAERLNQSFYFSLSQGSFAISKEQPSLKKSIWFLAGSFTILLVTWLTTSLLTLHQVKKETQQVDDKIAVIYKQFFPGAHQVISPRFRISQKLKGQTAGGESVLWHLLEQLTGPLQTSQVTLLQLTYQNQRINLKLIAPNFGQLEKFISAIKRESVRAKQLEANRNEDKVEATVEIWL